MAAISVTYTFANSTVADATQVNQNFTDIVNGTSDGTKDFSIGALTAAGTATLNGHVTLGSASNDDLTINASLASSIPIKTNNSYDIGSATLGLAGVYLGSAGGLTTRLIGGATGSSWSLTFPTTDGAARERLETNGSGVTSWQPVRRSPEDMDNIGLSFAVGSSALTITLTAADGTSLSSTNPADVNFRSATAATGTVTTRSITSALTLTISSGSTLGHSSGIDHPLYIYLLDSSGTVELAASTTRFDDGSVITTTAEGAGGGADSSSTIYSTTQRTSVPIRLVARCVSNQVTAGTWAAVPTEVSVGVYEPTRVIELWNKGTTEITNAEPVAIFSTKVKSTHNAYSTSTGAMTIPKTGMYAVHASIQVNANALGVAQELNCIIDKNSGTFLHYARTVGNSNSHTWQCDAHVVEYFLKGETVRVKGYSDVSTAMADTVFNNFFRCVSLD